MAVTQTNPPTKIHSVFSKTKEALVYQCYLNTCVEMQQMVDKALAQEGLAVDELAQALGVTKGAFYYHNKKDKKWRLRQDISETCLVK
jgi:hypothetical protein